MSSEYVEDVLVASWEDYSRVTVGLSHSSRVDDGGGATQTT